MSIRRRIPGGFLGATHDPFVVKKSDGTCGRHLLSRTDGHAPFSRTTQDAQND